MEQYQINNQFYSSIKNGEQNLPQYKSIINERTQMIAQKRQIQLQKYFYNNFAPYSDYFKIVHSQLKLRQGQSQFYLHGSIYDKSRLSLQRQSMYYRGAVDQYLTQQDIKLHLNQHQKQKGFIKRKGNCSVIIGGVLYFTQLSTLNAIQLPYLKKQEILQVYQQSCTSIPILDFGKGNQILQIDRLENNSMLSSSSFISNAHNNQTIILIRLSRKLIVFNITYNKIILQIDSSTEFIEINQSLYSRNGIQTVQYDGEDSFIKEQQLVLSDKSQNKHINNCLKINGLVHSVTRLNRNQLLVGKYDGLYIADRRQKENNITKIYSVMNLHKERIYSTIPIKSYSTFTPLLASCQSRQIGFTDIRRPDKLLSHVYHGCEQSPPQILQFYDGTVTDPLHVPILSCHSPYSLGSALFLPLNVQNLTNQHQSKWNNHENQNYFTLLSDTGKQVSKMMNIHQFYNRSISFHNQRQDQFIAYQVDNYGSVCMEVFAFNQSKDNYKRKNIMYSDSLNSKQNKNINIMNHQKTYQSSNQKWLQDHINSKYFSTLIIEINQQQKSQIIQINKSKKKKVKKQNKSKTNKIKNNKQMKKIQDLTQIQDLQLLDAQYQNSQQCQLSFSKRKLNYAIFNKFLSTLEGKAAAVSEQNHIQSKKQTSLIKQNSHFNSSTMNSTQPNSQTFTFSQNYSEETGIKTLAFHNKKSMNYSILEKLKNSWDN